MVYVPFTDLQWLVIEAMFRENHPGETRKELPVREVAAWFAHWTMTKQEAR